jgi:hypothetical protein
MSPANSSTIVINNCTLTEWLRRQDARMEGIEKMARKMRKRGRETTVSVDT